MIRILHLDIETAPNTAHVWGLWDQNVGLPQLLESGYVLCWAAAWHESREVMFDSLEVSTKEEMLKGIHALLEEADVVVHYNGVKFDIPTLNKEFVQIGMAPPSPYKQVDLMRVVKRQFRFPSNKLDYVCKALGLGTKTKHVGHQLWIDCMAGDQKAWKVMKRYNMNDVRMLKRLYLRLLPWINNHPNVGLYGQTSAPCCPTCGSTHLQSRGRARTTTSAYARFQCTHCGTWTRSAKTETTKRNRDLLLRAA